MLTKIAFDPEALGEYRDPPSLMKSIHFSILRALNAHGRIVFRNNAEAMKFIDATRASGLSPEIKKQWEVVLQYLHTNKRAGVMKPQDDLSISAISQLTEIESGWAGMVRVIILESHKAEAVGVPPDQGVLDDCSAELELATLHSATLTRAVSHLRELAASAVFPFSTRDSFWNQVLEPVAEISQSATILDKFIFKELWFRAKQPHRFARARPEQIVWLLHKLDESMCEGSLVEIIGYATPDDPSAERTAELIRSAWQPSSQGHLAKVQLSVAREHRGFPHDRHLRFNTSIGISLNAGFDRLSRPDCWDVNGMSWSYIYMPHDVEALRQREAQALELQVTTATVLQR